MSLPTSRPGSTAFCSARLAMLVCISAALRFGSAQAQTLDWIDRGFVPNASIGMLRAGPGPAYFAFSSDGYLYRSGNARDWNRVYSYPYSGSLRGNALISVGDAILAAYDRYDSGDPVIVSRDRGKTWNPTGLTGAIDLCPLGDKGALAWTGTAFWRADAPDFQWRKIPQSMVPPDTALPEIHDFPTKAFGGSLLGLPTIPIGGPAPLYRRELWSAPLDSHGDTLVWTRVGDTVPMQCFFWDTSIVANSPEGIMRSDDRGATWQKISDEKPENLREDVGMLMQSSGRDANQSYRFSVDGGKGWNDLPALKGRYIPRAMLVGDTVFASVMWKGRYGVQASKVGESLLFPSARGMRDQPVRMLAFHRGSLFGGADYLLGSLSLQGTSEWVDHDLNLNYPINGLASDGQYIYACYPAPLMRTAAGSPPATWDSAGARCSAITQGRGWVAVAAATPYNPPDWVNSMLVCRPAGGCVESGRGTFGFGSRNHSIRALAAQGDTLVAAYDTTYISTDAGVSWRKGTNSDSVIRLAFHGGDLYRVRKDSVRCNLLCIDRSSDLGSKWDSLPAGGPPRRRYCSITSTSMGLAAATDSGVFLSADRGASWSALDRWTTMRNHPGLAYEGGLLAVGHDDGGVHILDLRTVGLYPAKNSASPRPSGRKGQLLRYRGDWRKADGRRVR